MPTPSSRGNWASAWPDAVAFGLGLAVARWAGWNTADLIWSLWLSSLVVGYCTIVWMIGQPSFVLLRESWKERDTAGAIPGALTAFRAVVLGGATFLLAFFTLHFGMFHYVHSQFLMSFFPIHAAGDAGHAPRAGLATYAEVVRRYWIFLPSAFLSHRAAFLRKPLTLDRDLSVTSFFSGDKRGGLMMEPYRNVLRMHLLIFFFFCAHFLGLESFAVYAVVYAVYFFPWNVLQRPAPVMTGVPTQ
jgi:hypothetical protein